jgi:hypothetical protein
MRATTSLTVGGGDDLSLWNGRQCGPDKTAAGKPPGTSTACRPEGLLGQCATEVVLYPALLQGVSDAGRDGFGFGITQGQVSELVGRLTSRSIDPPHRPVREARELAQLLAEQPELREVIVNGRSGGCRARNIEESKSASIAGERSAMR